MSWVNFYCLIRNGEPRYSYLNMGCTSSKINEGRSKFGTRDKQDSVVSQSSGSDEDIANTTAQIDEVGRKTVSNADLINVQRQEKTDVSVVLENRWLKHHFSTSNTLKATHKKSSKNFETENHNDDVFLDQNANYKSSPNVLRSSDSYYESHYEHQHFDCDFKPTDVLIDDKDVCKNAE